MAELKEINIDENLTHVALIGRLDISGMQKIEFKFTSTVVSRGKPALIDMSEVSFLASLGMRMLLSAAKSLEAKNAKIALLSPQPLVKEALEAAGFNSILPIEDELDKALAFLST